MIVGIDPETGQLGMPTPEQMQRMFPLGVSAQNQSDQSLPIVHGPGGAIGVDLQGRFKDYTFVRIGPDGKKTLGCSQNPAVIEKALQQPAPAPAVYEER